MNLEDIGIRLAVATLIGCMIGLNRFAHHRFIGVRTLGLVSLGAAALVVAALETGSGSDQLAAASRIIQGIVTGIGFIGAGAILHRGSKVQGLTTAASLWVAAAIGVSVGVGMFLMSSVATALVFALLHFGPRVPPGSVVSGESHR